MIGTTLVLGGTGKTGSRLVKRLQASGRPVRIGSRAGSPRFDWQDQETWAPALQNVQSVYIAYQPDLAFPGAAETVAALAELAVESGARRPVLLSGRGEESAQRGEKAVQASGAEWTIIRSSFMNQNFSESFLLDAVLGGQLINPVADAAEPFIDAEDIADLAFAVLTEEGHRGELYEVTGPALMTFSGALGEISRVTGLEVRYVAVSPEEYTAALIEEGVPDDLAASFTELFATVLDGRNAYLADGVQRGLGREPRDFAEFARRTAASGAWGGMGGTVK